MRRPRAAFSRARATAEPTAASGRTAPPSDGGRTRDAENGRGPVEAAPTKGSWTGLALSLGILALMVVVGFYLRVHNNDYGLPYVYNFDEATHFTNRAVSFFTSDFNPGYFQNPSAFTYIVYVVLKLGYGVTGLLPGLTEPSVTRQFSFDPTPIWETARTTAAVLAMIGVVATWWVGRSIWRTEDGRPDDRVGLAAAAVLCFAFLSVVYSRIAVTDVGTFLPIAIATWATLRAYDEGKLWQYALAGAGVGLAIGFKYTAGLAILPVLLVAAVRAWRDRETPWLKKPDVRWFIVACAAMVVLFGITNPYFFLKPVSALYQLKQQAEAAGGSEKLGQEQVGGYRYYIESLGWGFGYAAAFFAIAGAVFEIRRDRVRGIALILFPIALYLYMGSQTRYFGRWLLPMYPVIALLAGVGIVRLVQLIPVIGKKRVLTALSVAVLTLLVLIHPVASDVRSLQVLGKQDTRQLARDYLVKNYPQSLRVVIEPAVPTSFYRIEKSKSRKRQFVRGFIRDIRRAQNVDAPDGTSLTYAASLDPAVIDQYRQKGFCLVETMSLIRGRAENAKVPGALAYYKRLENESKLVFQASPFDKGAKPVPLHFDFSYDYYPSAYYRPGPEVKIYKLNNCRQQFGKVPNAPAGTKGLDKGIGTSFVQGGAD
jgi:hypothetical protein